MIATEAQKEEQRNLGLDIGCHICAKLGREIPFPPTHKWLNPYCVQCKKLYCEEHSAKADTHFCKECLSDA